MTAVSNKWEALEWAKADMKNHRQIILQAVKQNWEVLEVASADVKGDRQVHVALVQSLKNYQCSTEGQKLHQNLAPLLAITSGNFLAFSRKLFPVLVFTGAVP